MTQQASDVGIFGPWLAHFEQNERVHAEVDAAIAFEDRCDIPDSVRHPLIESVRRFQLGESGDGEQLLHKAARPVTRIPARRRTVRGRRATACRAAAAPAGYLDGQPMRTHWSDAVFVRLRRLMGLRTELMVLTVAEVVALSYYGGLAEAGPDDVVRAVAARIVADEHPHVRFQQDRLRAGFAGSRAGARALAFAFWWLTAIGATVVVALDHGPLLDAIGYRRTRFIRDVLIDFAKVVTAVLRR